MAARPRIRAAVLLVQEGSVLLVRHRKGGRTYWLLPGGGVEFCEPAPEAARREVLEETGLEVEVQGLAMVAETIAPDRSRHLLHLVFHGRLTGGTLCVGQEERLAEARFVPLEQVPDLALHPPLGAALGAAVVRPEAGAVYLGRLWVD